MFVQKSSQEPGVIVGGISQIYLEHEVKDRLDKLLAYLESQEGVCGSGTMLILGDSALHSRFPLHETRMVFF